MTDRRRLLAEMEERSVNFEPSELPEVATDPWHVDDYCRPLPGEPAGEPLADGSFASARQLMMDYEFADPRMVRAVYDADAPLLGRTMLLEIRFYLVRVFTGVRVSEVFDEVRDTDDGPARIWGWAYRTLEGHLERGQMDYQVWKWLDSGRIEFRIHAVSELIGSPNPVLHAGFRLVGRREQTRFARHCGERMESFVTQRLERGPGTGPTPDRVGGAKVSPATDEPAPD